MAKKQTRRTVSIGRPYYERLTAYAESNGVSGSALTEFALDLVMSKPLDRAAFLAWSAEREVEVDARWTANWTAAMRRRAPDPEPAVRAHVVRPEKSLSDQAAEHAHQNGVSLSEAARVFKITRAAVSQAADKLGLSRRSPARVTPEDLAARGWPTRPLIETGARCVSAANDVIRGMPVAEAAHRRKVALSAVYKVLRCPPICAIDQEAA